MSALSHTFSAGDFMPQLSKSRYHGVILHALAPLAAEAPAVDQGAIFSTVDSQAARRALAPPFPRGARRAKMYRVRVSAQNSRNRRVLGARVLLDRGGDGDAF